ncbi:MAG TPA: SMI1/KNR4 family protein [Ktedonobacteraceae bacterium]
MSDQVDHPGRMMVIWNFIEDWMQRNAPDLLVKLRPPATEPQIQAVEAALSVTFPEEIKAFWSIHDGTDNTLFGWWQFLSMQEIMRECQQNRTYEWWPATWIPFASDWCGDYICMDMDSALQERRGQIMYYDHEGGNLSVAPSLWILMSTFVNDLEDGEYEVNEYGVLVSEEVNFPW